jgi:hypothetical protein
LRSTSVHGVGGVKRLPRHCAPPRACSLPTRQKQFEPHSNPAIRAQLRGEISKRGTGTGTGKGAGAVSGPPDRDHQREKEIP